MRSLQKRQECGYEAWNLVVQPDQDWMEVDISVSFRAICRAIWAWCFRCHECRLFNRY